MNTADSNIISTVSSFIPDSRPPIIPATPSVFSPLVIINISGSSFLSWPSSVVNTSLCLAFLTTIFLFPISLISKACIGWPISSITKLVISTMLFIGLTPASINLLCIQYGDFSIFTSVTLLARYLEHKAGFSILISTSISLSDSSFTLISGYLVLVPKVTAASLAIPIIHLQSGLFDVNSKSMTASFKPRTSLISIPGTYDSSMSSI